MSTSRTTVPGDQYLGGLFVFVYRAIRKHLLLMILLPLAAMTIAYWTTQQLPLVYTAQASIRIGRLDGAEAPVGAVSRINSLSFKQRLVQTMGLSLSDGSRPAQLIFTSLTAKQEAADTVAVTVRAPSAQQARDAVAAVVGLLNEQQQMTRGPLEADIKERLATNDVTIAGLLETKDSLAVLEKEDAKGASADPASAALRRIWLSDLLSRNEQRLSQAKAEQRALLTRLGASNTYPAVLLDDAFVSAGSTVARRLTIAIFAGGMVFLILLIGILFRGSKAVRSA